MTAKLVQLLKTDNVLLMVGHQWNVMVLARKLFPVEKKIVVSIKRKHDCHTINIIIKSYGKLDIEVNVGASVGDTADLARLVGPMELVALVTHGKQN